MVLRLPDSWSNWNLEMLVFEERGKTEYPEKNLSEQGREPITNSTHMVSTPGFEPGQHWWEASALTTAPPLLPLPSFFPSRIAFTWLKGLFLLLTFWTSWEQSPKFVEHFHGLEAHCRHCSLETQTLCSWWSRDLTHAKIIGYNPKINKITSKSNSWSSNFLAAPGF